MTRIDCPVCGHYAHRKFSCMGGMGDYCDCGHDAGYDVIKPRSTEDVSFRDSIKHGPPDELAGMDE